MMRGHDADHAAEITALVDRIETEARGAWVGGPSKVLGNRAALG